MSREVALQFLPELLFDGVKTRDINKLTDGLSAFDFAFGTGVGHHCVPQLLLDIVEDSRLVAASLDPGLEWPKAAGQIRAAQDRKALEGLSFQEYCKLVTAKIHNSARAHGPVSHKSCLGQPPQRIPEPAYDGEAINIGWLQNAVGTPWYKQEGEMQRWVNELRQANVTSAWHVLTRPTDTLSKSCGIPMEAIRRMKVRAEKEKELNATIEFRFSGAAAKNMSEHNSVNDKTWMRTALTRHHLNGVTHTTDGPSMGRAYDSQPYAWGNGIRR